MVTATLDRRRVARGSSFAAESTGRACQRQLSARAQRTLTRSIEYVAGDGLGYRSTPKHAIRSRSHAVYRRRKKLRCFVA